MRGKPRTSGAAGGYRIAETDFRYEQYVRGDQNVPKRKKYREADERILTIVTEYRNQEILEYLRRIAHNFQME
ncbi:hypothetical protein AAVH_14863 [Aphelenchoides avenae]|nr:hypothetical protein AAVH_14863 [Aphelenchus avenae]